VNLIPRFYDYTSGEILLDGIRLHAFDRHFLRSVIGIVEQEPFLFSVTVKENIVYGAGRDVTGAEIEKAAMAAAIHDTIAAFTSGYDTMIGEKGVNLSGGQKQRIAIARAILKNPRILILDDSTSSVDSGTEQTIQEAMDRLIEGRTVFIIAHRIRTLMRADKIIVMKNGRIVQMGTHDELVSEGGFYRDVYERQTCIESELSVELQSSEA
jgi:ABC-type multidrug transport system fused ATPase/permease subunit